MKKKRLIICSGYYSIVNTVSVLKQRITENLEGSSDYENVLVIISHNQDPEVLSSFSELFNIFDSINKDMPHDTLLTKLIL